MPVQPLKDGIMVKVTSTGDEVVFVNVPHIFPVPLAAMSLQVTVLSLVQLKIVPLSDPVNKMFVIDDPEQMI